MNTFVRRLSTDIPLLTADSLAWIVARSKDDMQMAESQFVRDLRERLKPKMEIKDGVAIIPIEGALAYRPDIFELYFGEVEDSRHVLGMIHEARMNENVKGILLRMDTPGGMLLGGPEIADAVNMCRDEGKPVVAHIGGLGASLGYLIASQANEIIASRSAIVGSIGVIATVTDWTAYLAQWGVRFEVFTNAEATYKGAGSPGTSLTQAQRQNIQDSVQASFELFKSMVLSTRPRIKPETMRGQTFRGVEAKSVGLVDRIGDENFALGILRREHMNSKGKS